MGKPRALEKEGKAKEAWLSFCKRLDQDTLELPEPGRGSLGSAGKNQLGFRQLKKACSWTQGTKKDMSYQLPIA